MTSFEGYPCNQTNGELRNCAACSEPNGYECISCQPGYTYPISACIRRMCDPQNYILQERCLDCNEPFGIKCKFCVDGYTTQDNYYSKVPCFDYLKNCDRCSQDYPEYCVECKPGYRGSTCDSIYCDPNDPSLENCESCTTPNGSTCDSCLGGFMDPAYKCALLECDKVFAELEHCYSCEGEQAMICSKCMEGFSLQGNRCSKVKKNVGKVVGIIIAVLVVAVAAAVFLWWYFCKRDSGVRGFRRKEIAVKGDPRVAAEQ